MAIDTVNPGESITAQKYNEIQAQIDAVLGKNANGYGYYSSSSPVSSKDIIKAEHYAKLYNDIRRCRIHQAGSSVSMPGGITVPQVGDVIYAAYTNNLIAAAELALANRYAAEAGQMNSYASPQSLIPFNASYTHTTTYEWDTDNDMRYFFNLGGYLSAQIGYIGSPSSPLENLWVSAIPVANAAMQQYTRTDFLASAVGSTKTLYTNNGVGDIILVTVTQLTGKKLELKFQMVPSAPLTIGISSQAAYHYSRGDLGGVPAPVASVSTTLNSGAPIVVIPTTRILNVSAGGNNVYSFTAGQISSPQTYTISNSGNAALTVTGINFNNATGITATPSYGWSLPLTLSQGDSQTFTLTYSGSPGAGTWNSSFTVVSSNSTNGNVTVPTSQVVTVPAPPPFSFSLSPSSVSYTQSDSSGQPTFTISITDATAAYSDFSTNLGSGADFSIFSRFGSSVVVLYNNQNPNGVYSDTLYVTINGVTRSAVITVTRSVPAAQENRNLSTWVSALAPQNAVVGASYDIINDQRFLTLGFGIGAESAPDLARGGINYIDANAVNNLTITGDDKYWAGPALYYSFDDTTLPTFLRPPSAGGYGAWIINRETTEYWYRYFGFDSNKIPVLGYSGKSQDLKYLDYTIYCPVDGNHTIEFGLSRDSGFYTIDGNLFDLRTNLNRGWNTRQDTVFLSQGNHSLRIAYLGQYSCAIAMQITGPNGEVWSTRTPMRSADPFKWWSEVYRFPIYADGTPRTYYSANYCLKATRMIEQQQTGYKWGDYFGQPNIFDPNPVSTGSMFIVRDDGQGNLDIVTNGGIPSGLQRDIQNTLLTVQGDLEGTNHFMYWIPEFLNRRYRNLEGQNPSNPYYSRKFVGFDRSGAVRTSLVPNYMYYYDPNGPGYVNNIDQTTAFTNETTGLSPLFGTGGAPQELP